MRPPIAAWDLGEPVTVEPFGSGLINMTFAAHGPSGLRAFVQRLNTDIFAPEVHEDIEAVTCWLAGRGLQTPRLIRTRSGTLWHASEGGVWRALTPVGDRTVDKLVDLDDARSAGELVARFHGAMAGFDWDFRSVRPGAHDTLAHLERLRRALAEHRGHRLYARVAPLAERILAGWERWDGRLDGLPPRVIHGDLKISNIRFQGPEAVALIDLDTLAWGTLDVDLGDALRSWCNPATEDSGDARFDLALFAAAVEGYGRHAVDVTEEEWAAVVPGIERLCWELAARFAADALNEAYFGWDPARYGSRGEHNLARAEGQARLAESVRAQRAEAEEALRTARRA